MPAESGYGRGTTSAASAATGDNLSANYKTYTFTDYMSKAWVEILTDTCPDLFIRWNHTVCAITGSACDHRLTVNRPFIASPDGTYVKTVAIYCASAATLGTDFVVKGWH